MKSVKTTFPFNKKYHPSSGLMIPVWKVFLSKQLYSADTTWRRDGSGGAESKSWKHFNNTLRSMCPTSHCSRTHSGPAGREAHPLVHVSLTWGPWPALLNTLLINGYHTPSFPFHSQYRVSTQNLALPGPGDLEVP